MGAESAYAHYSSFSVDTEKNYYMLRLAGHSGTAGKEAGTGGGAGGGMVL